MEYNFILLFIRFKEISFNLKKKNLKSEIILSSFCIVLYVYVNFEFSWKSALCIILNIRTDIIVTTGIITPLWSLHTLSFTHSCKWHSSISFLKVVIIWCDYIQLYQK